MPVAISLRFDDDLAAALRARAEVEHCSVNRLVNDGMRDYLARRSAEPLIAAHGEEGRQVLRGLQGHLEELDDVLSEVNRHQESEQDFKNNVQAAFKEVRALFAIIAGAADPGTVPTVTDAPRDRVHA